MKTRKRRESVAFIVAHPDDVAHSMGGTALLLARRYDLHVFCASRGQRGIKGRTLDQAARIREKEEAAACRVLGASLTFLDQVDGEVFADGRTCRLVADALRRLRPRAVFTLWPINRHPDHVAAYAIADQAVRMAGLAGRTDVLMSENAVGVITRQYEPEILVDISDVIERKKALVRLHRSQNPTEKRVEAVIARNAFRAKYADCEYAEAFKLAAPIAVRSSGRVSVAVLLELRRPSTAR